MKCPNDQTTLLITDRSGIEIDYCPECRGVWLDRGELDKIIERNASPSASMPHYSHDAPKYNDSKNYPEQPGYHKKKRKESFLGDLFDF